MIKPAIIAKGFVSRLGLKPYPLSLTYELSWRCNLACSYCDRHTPMKNELRREEIFDVLAQFQDLGMQIANLDGGEALLHQNIDEIVDWLVGRKITVTMHTNGMLIPNKLDTVRKISSVKISLDGPRENHEMMRGVGSFDRALAGAKAAKAEGIQVAFTCTVGRHNIHTIDALIAMRREHNLTPDQIRRVEIGLHRNGITLTGDAATKRHPTSIVGGQFSMFFTGAVALDQGRFGWDDYDRLGDKAVDALADKFDVVQDDRLEIGRTHPFGARVSITTDDGLHERLYPDPSGEPNSFPDAQAMAQKFLTLARPVLNGRADQLADAILSLERFDRVETATHFGRQ